VRAASFVGGLPQANEQNQEAVLEKALIERRHMETIGNLSGNFAHDFNNLMQVLTGAVELLINDRESPRDSSLINRMESVVGIALATGRSTIAQLLAYSKNRDLYPVPIHIGDYLKETEPLIRSLTGESVDLKIVDSSAGASILADTSQLTGAILNLVKNAKEAIELSDGRIEIVVEPSASDSSRLLIRVIDNGEGMTPSQIAQAVDPFYTTKDNAGGTGRPRHRG